MNRKTLWMITIIVILVAILANVLWFTQGQSLSSRMSPLPGWWQQFVEEGGEWGVTENWHGGGIE